MANTDNNTIELKISSDSPRLELTNLSSHIYPGFLLERDGPGGCRRGPAEGLPAQAIFAIENKAIGGGIEEIEDNIYDTGDRVIARLCRRGDWVLAYLINGAGEGETSVGTYLISKGGGKLRAAVTPVEYDDEVLVGVALEAIDNSAGAGAVPIIIEVL
jgi:hypothetical protein